MHESLSKCALADLAVIHAVVLLKFVLGSRGPCGCGAMRKRPEASKPQISDKTLAIIQQARACHHKPAPKPMATPARSATPLPVAEGTVEAPSTPAQLPGESQAATPMSTQTVGSSPVKSPEVKRLKSECSLSASEVPSLPSFKESVEPAALHHSDSATTLSLTEYYMNKMRISGQS